MQFRLCFSKFVPVGPGRGFIFEILALVRDMLQGPLIYLASFFKIRNWSGQGPDSEEKKILGRPETCDRDR